MESPSKKSIMTDPDYSLRLQTAVDAGEITPGTAKNVLSWLQGPAGNSDTAAREIVLGHLEAGSVKELEPYFWEVIPFGTGGRRGPMAPFGTATLNARTVAESADGLARYLKALTPDSEHSVVVAYDTRHRSAEFAQIAARTLAGRGVRVALFEAPRATPELSFAVRQLKCSAGLMISASHNPPSDNGVKVYWSNGGQVLPPHDKGIIDAVGQTTEIPMADFDTALQDGTIRTLEQEMDVAYLDAVIKAARLANNQPAVRSAAKELRILYSPLHGVGETSVALSLSRGGFQGLEIYEPQRVQDGSFPNVPEHLPNPERPDVFQPLLSRAHELSADLVLATDPDADRLGCLLPDRTGNFQYISGNRLAVLLADFILQRRQQNAKKSPEDYLVQTLVTTPLVAALGRAHGVRVIDQLLVGFKYIGETVEREGPEHFLFGCEESHGYLAGDYCRDKDAAIAALLLAEATAVARAEGRLLWDRLDAIFVEQGYYAERQLSVTRPGAAGQAEIQKLMNAFREHPPRQFGSIEWQVLQDYQQQVEYQLQTSATERMKGPRGAMLILEGTSGETKLSLAGRPSGTEPKMKFYLFANTPVSDPGQLPAVREQTELRLDELVSSLHHWIEAVCQQP